MTEKRRATIAAKSVKNNTEERKLVFKHLSEIQGYGLLDSKKALSYLTSKFKFDAAKSESYIAAFRDDPYEPLDASDFNAICERLSSYYKVIPYDLNS